MKKGQPPAAIACKRSRCSTRSPSCGSTPSSAGPVAMKRRRAPRNASTPTATSSDSGIHDSSGPSSGISSMPASIPASTFASSRCRTGPNWTSGEYIAAEDDSGPDVSTSPHPRAVFARDGLLLAHRPYSIPLPRRGRHRTAGAIPDGRRRDLHWRSRVGRDHDGCGHRRNPRLAPLRAGQPLSTTCDPTRRWKIASARATSDGPSARRHRRKRRRREEHADRAAALRNRQSIFVDQLAADRERARRRRGDDRANLALTDRRPARRARTGHHDRRRLPLLSRRHAASSSSPTRRATCSTRATW